MAFDPSSAKIESSGFDPTAAQIDSSPTLGTSSNSNVPSSFMSQQSPQEIGNAYNKGNFGLMDNSGYGLPSSEDAAKQVKNIGELGAYGAANALVPEYRLASPVLNAISRIGTGAAANGLTGAALNPDHPLVSGLSNALLGAGAYAIPGLLKVGGNIGSGIKNIFRDIPQETAEGIQQNHDLLKNKAVEGFKNVSQEAINRNLPPVPIDQDLLNEIKRSLPNTDASKDLLNSAKTGSYNALRDLQSDLWEEAQANFNSPLRSEQNLGKKIMEQRGKINNSISNHLIDTGNSDLNDILNNSMKDYYHLNDIYYSNPVISKLVGKDRILPKNIMNPLSNISEPLKKLKLNNPFIDQNLQDYNNRKNVLNLIKGLPVAAGTLGAGAYGLEHFFK